MAQRTIGREPGLSIVVPVHNEAASLPRLHAELAEVARTLNAKHGLACEVIYVDDGSRDDTLAIAHQLLATALDIQLLSLSRNFGKEAALLAGLDHARLGAVLFIDGDGQHPPSLIETSSTTGSMTVTTWSTPPRRIGRTSSLCGGSW